MSKAFDLPRIAPPPPPPEPKLCLACKAFRAECLVPIGEASAPMCWVCAHHVVEHDCKLEDVVESRCECTPDKIYPLRAEAAAMWTGLYATCGIDINPKPSTEKQRSIEEINADIARLTSEIGSNIHLSVENMTPAQRKIYEGTARPPHGPYTGSVKGLKATKLWVDDPKKR